MSRPTDASKQGRSIEDIDADVDVSLVDETQERQDDDLIFDTRVLDDVEMSVEAKVDRKDKHSTKKLSDSTAGEAVTTAGNDSVVPTTNEEITLAQTLIQIKAAKPKVVTTTATTTTTTRPKDKGVVVQEPSEFRVPQEIKPLSSKDKGKGIMVELEVPLKRKDQIALDEQIARDIQAKLDAKLLEEQKLARKQEEEANIALIESWENTQAMMEADRLLAERLQLKERDELTDEEKAKLFMEPMEKRRKHFAALRAQEKRNKPPTKAQKRTQMSTYLKHMGGYTYKQLKGKSFDEIQKLFDKEMKRVNTFVAMGSEVQENKEKKEEGREETAKGSRKKMLGRKRAVKEQQEESSKKQKVEEEKESEEVEEDDEVELKKLLVIKKDEDIAIDAIPLATKLLVIIEYKLYKKQMLVHYELIRADGSSKRYSSMIRMLQGIDREDLEALWRIVKGKYGDTRPEDEFERVLYGDLRVMFEPDIKSDVWRMLQGYRVTTWKLIDSSGVHFVRFDNLYIFMLVERRYPLTPITITNMLNKKLQTDHQNEMCYQLLKLMIQKMNIKFRGGLLGLKRLHGFLEVTAVQIIREVFVKLLLDSFGKLSIREEARHPITKNINSISLIRIEEEENRENNRPIDKSIMELGKSDEETPPKGIGMKKEVERKADDEPAKSTRENVINNEEDEPAEVSSSHVIGYYLKHRINEKLIEGLVENQKFNDSLSTTREDIGGNFEIPYNVGGLKHTNALVDQGSDVNVMPLSTYNKLTDERHAETNIRLRDSRHKGGPKKALHLRNMMRLSLDFNNKFYNSIGCAPNRCSVV
ncbi:hypothetical protein Tco_0524769 [Tanacetum coccineum]